VTRFYQAGVLALLFACNARAQTNEPSTIDTIHEAASEVVSGAADSIDRYVEKKMTPEEDRPSETLEQFFGPMRDVESNDSQVQLAPLVEFSEDGTEFGVRFAIRLKLPRSGDRIQIIVDNVTQDDLALRDFRTLREEDAELDNGKDGVAGLRFFLVNRVEKKLSLDTGLKLKPEPVPRSRLRGILRIKMDSFRIEPSQSVFWESSDGFGERTQLEFIVPRGSQTTFRATSAAVWSETSTGLDLGQSFSAAHQLDERNVIGVKFGVSGYTSSSTRVDKYALRFPFRHRFHRSWLRLSVEPGVEFPRDEEFQAKPLLKLQIDISFGELPDD
jgi:hypothetical protein